MADDEKVLKLIEQIKKQKNEIRSAERTVWKTNCSAWLDNKPVNLQVESDVSNLLRIAANFISTRAYYEEAADQLDLDKKSVPPLKINGYKVEDWLDDIKTRINKLQVSTKRETLSKLEERLNKIVSPELRAKLELEEIEREMSGN